MKPDGSRYPDSARVRLGFISNEQNECVSPDSFVGFGTDYYTIPNSAGNYACPSCTPDNGSLNTKAMGYILAR